MAKLNTLIRSALFLLSIVLTAVAPFAKAEAAQYCSAIFENSEDMASSAIGDSGYHAEITKFVAHIPEKHHQGVNIVDLEVIETRGEYDGSTLPNGLQSPIIGGVGIPLDLALASKTAKSATGLKLSSLWALYESYKKQGEGRSDNIPVYEKEDRDEARRTTDYTWVNEGEAVGRLQAQYSGSSSSPLNTEKHFPDVINFIRGHDLNTPAIELGRLLLLKSTYVSTGKNKKLLSSRSGRSRIFNMMWLNTLLDLKNISQDTVVVFQANQTVLEEVLVPAFAPGSLSNRFDVSTSSNQKEYVVKLSHADVLNLIQHFTRRWLVDTLEEFLTAVESRPNANIQISISKKFTKKI